LIDSDVGRPLADLAILVDYPELLADAESVLATLQGVEKQARAPDGVWYTARIRPYRTAHNAVEGLVLTFIDITETKRAELADAARTLAESIVDAVREPLLVLDPSLRVTRANRSFYRAFEMEPVEVEGRELAELGKRRWDMPRLLSLLAATLRGGAPFEGFEVEAELPRVGRRRIVLSGRPVSVGGIEESLLLVLGIEDAGEAPAASPSREVET
jgi:two-component system, chemotaxis family, CheB/CheR fusion protein